MSINNHTSYTANNFLNNNCNIKYKQNYDNLHKILILLENLNKEIQNKIFAKETFFEEPKPLEYWLDEFAIKVLRKKTIYDSILIQNSSSECIQTFMAKRWRTRYYHLIELAKLISQESELHTSISNTLQEMVCCNNNQSSIFINQDMKQLNEKLTGKFVEDVLLIQSENNILNQVPSLYVEGDHFIPISLFFLQNLLTTYNSTSNKLKKQNDIKIQLKYILKETKEQRNVLKQKANKLDNDIRYLETNIIKTISKTEHLKQNNAVQNIKASVLSDVMNQIELEKKNNILMNEVSIDNDIESQETINQLMIEDETCDARIHELKLIIKEEEKKRRSICTKLHGLTELPYVYCFVKLNSSKSSCLELVSTDKIILSQIPVGGLDLPLHKTNISRCFIFDHVFSVSEPSNLVAAKLLDKVMPCLNGKSVCIMNYGYIGSGKTYSFFGEHFNSYTDKTNDNWCNSSGLVQCLVDALFQSLQNKNELANYCITVSVLEMTDAHCWDHLLYHPDALVQQKSKMQSTMFDKIVKPKQVQLTSFKDFVAILTWLRQERLSDSGKSGHLVISLSINNICLDRGSDTKETSLSFIDTMGWQIDTQTINLESSEANNLSLTAQGEIDNIWKVSQTFAALNNLFRAMRKTQTPTYNNSCLTMYLKPIFENEAKFILCLNVNDDSDLSAMAYDTMTFGERVPGSVLKMHKSKMNK